VIQNDRVETLDLRTRQMRLCMLAKRVTYRKIEAFRNHLLAEHVCSGLQDHHVAGEPQPWCRASSFMDMHVRSLQAVHLENR
jgi:hypothetical protein